MQYGYLKNLFILHNWNFVPIDYHLPISLSYSQMSKLYKNSAKCSSINFFALSSIFEKFPFSAFLSVKSV